MTAVADDASLYDYQESIVSNAKALVHKTETAGGSSQNYGQGKMTVLYSELAAVTGSGGAGDTIDFMKLPPGTLVVGGWLYTEDGFGADNVTIDLGVAYEDSDGTDDTDAFIDAVDVYDGATGDGKLDALPAGNLWKVGSDVAAFPYLVTGGWGTVRLTSSAALITSKDCKLVLQVIMPA